MGHLKKAAAQGKMSHAYIINGAAGSGKKTFAEYMAAALLCNEGIEKGPCRTCDSCIKASTHNHPDIIWVEHEKPSVLSVQEVRDQLIRTIDIAPYYGPYKIYIVKDAQLLNEHGQNALLKTIEEPPAYVLIFLLTDNAEAFLDTIRSRCIRLDMESLPREQIEKELEKAGVPRFRAEECASFSKGNLGLAKILSKDGDESELRESALKTLKNLNNSDALEIFDFSSSLDKETGLDVLKYMLMWYRDVLLVKVEADPKELYYVKEKAVLERQSKAVSFEELNQIFEALDEARDRLLTSVKCEAVFETLLLTIREKLKNGKGIL